MKKIFIIFGIIMFSSNITAQFNATSAMQKYWNYRYALLGDTKDPSFPSFEPGFIEVGSGPGYSIPMTYRRRINSGDPMLWRSDNVINPENIEYDYGKLGYAASQIGQRYGECHWKDAPTELGRYIGVLATEFAMLKKNVHFGANFTPVFGPNYYKNLERVLTELKFALDAVDRLDISDHIAYNQGYHGGDGFIMRDDVPFDFAFDGKFGQAQNLAPDFLTNQNSRYYEGNSFYIARSSWMWPQIAQNPHAMGSTGGCETFPGILWGSRGYNTLGDPMSHDQLIKLLFGLILVRKYVNGGYLVNSAQFGGLTANDLNDQAYAFIDRSIWYLKKNCFNIYHPGTSTHVCAGPNAVAFRVPLNGIYDRWASGDNFPSAWNCTNWSPSLLMWPVLLDYYEKAVFSPSISISFPSMVSALTQFIYQATMNGIAGLTFSGANYFSHELAAMLMAMDGEDRVGGLLTQRLGERLDQDKILDLEYQNDAYLGDYKNLIQDGVFAPASPNSYLENFMTRSNFECDHEFRRFVRHNAVDGFYERNGLNYMLAHNIYYLQNRAPVYIDASDNTLAAFPQLFDRTISGTFPRTFTSALPGLPAYSWTYANSTTPSLIQASNSITSSVNNCTVLPTGRLTLRAPHIELLPGFDARVGSVVLLDSPKRMDCTQHTVIPGFDNNGNFISNVSAPIAPPPSGGNLQNKMAKPEQENDFHRSEVLFPNPASDYVVVSLRNYINLAVNIQIFDVLGQVVSDKVQKIPQDFVDQVRIPLHHLGTGIYIVKISYGDTIKSLKLQKE